MTHHSCVDYQCKYCCAKFVPIPEASNCPNCGLKSQEVFSEFIYEVFSSATFNMSDARSKSAIPIVWSISGIGDWYYWMTFQFISFVSEELKIEEREVLQRKYSENTVSLLASRFVEHINCGKTDYLKSHLKAQLVVFLSSAKTNYIRMVAEAKKNEG
jgi:hypothetical protein